MFDSANSLFQTGHQRKGTPFQRYQQISVVTSIMVSIRAGNKRGVKNTARHCAWGCFLAGGAGSSVEFLLAAAAAT